MTDANTTREAAERLWIGIRGVAKYQQDIKDRQYIRADIAEREKDRYADLCGDLRRCASCGRYAGRDHNRAMPLPDCKSPDACTFNFTPNEAWDYWRDKALTAERQIAEAEAKGRREGLRLLLAGYDKFMVGQQISEAENEAQIAVATAAAFAAAAYEKSPSGGNDVHALARVFLIALIDPTAADLDYLRAEPASGEAARDIANTLRALIGEADHD